MKNGRTNDGLRFGEGTIVQRGDSFQARWQETSPAGKVVRRGRSFPTQDAAEDHLRLMFRTRRDGRYVAPSELTVSEIIESWLTRGTARWKPWTLVTYRNRAALHIAPELGQLRAETLTTPRVQHWIDGMIRRGLNASTIDAAIIVLRSALKEAVQIGNLSRNPVVGTRAPSVEISESPTWDAESVQAVMRSLEDPMWSAVYRLALSTGLRPGELRSLKWADIDLNAATMTIRRTMTRDENGTIVIGKTTKTGRSRVIALAPTVVRSLATWQTAQKVRQLACEAWHKDDLIFDRGDGQYLPQATWHRFHVKLCADAGVQQITLHQLRHSHATLELSAGTHPLLVSTRLGHKSISTTLDRYSHAGLEVHRSAALAFDTRLFGDDEALSATTKVTK